MAMILEPFMKKCCTSLADYVHEEVTMLHGVKDELQKLLDQMTSIQCLLQDAEKRRFDESSTELWLSRLEDVMYDIDDIIDRCRIEDARLLDGSITFRVCCNFSFLFDCFTGVRLSHEIGKEIKKLNARLDQIHKNKERYKLKESAEMLRITPVNPRQTSPILDHLLVGNEIEDATDRLVRRLVTENVEEKCRLFAVTGMGGIGKTALAQKIYTHEIIKSKFNLNIWACVSQTFSEIELLQRIIRGAKGDYGNANTKAELLLVLRESVASGQSLFLVLDDAWIADVWVNLLKGPLHDAEMTVRVLVTTRDENVAKGMKAAHIHPVELLSTKSGWDMLHRLVFPNGVEQANEYQKLGFEIVEKCKHLPLAIKAIAGVLNVEMLTKKAWEEILSNEAWSISNLPEELRGALYLSFEVLPSHLKHCFLYFSLYPEDYIFSRNKLAQIWVAEGFITKQEENLLMEDDAKKYFDELLARNLLQPCFNRLTNVYNMHDLMRSLAVFLSNKESLLGNENMKILATSTKLRRLSVAGKSVPSTETLDKIAYQAGIRTLLASGSDLLLDHKRLIQLSRLRLLDISNTGIKILPDSIGSLFHLRYLDLSKTDITTIPKSVERLAYLQFLKISKCEKLTQLPSGIIRLENLRHLNLFETPISFIPKGIGNLKWLNELRGFVVANNDSSCQLEELHSLNQIRKLSIHTLERARSGANIIGELSNLSRLTLDFTDNNSERSVEELLAAEKLFDELKPPPNLEKLHVTRFVGNHFPDWMGLSTFERCVPRLTKLSLTFIPKCTELPPLGQMPQLRDLLIEGLGKVKKIGPKFFGGGVIPAVGSSIRIAFPKLQKLHICLMFQLEEWSFGAEVEENASPRLKLLPCLHELRIMYCPSLEQLPKGLKHSPIKILMISHSSIQTLDDLPAEIEDLGITNNEKLEMVCCPLALKVLQASQCHALSCVENLDSLPYLYYFGLAEHSLPNWLERFLRQRRQNDSNENFKLDLYCSKNVIQKCLQGGSYWDFIRHIPQVTAHEFLNPHNSFRGNGYLRYIKQLNVYDTNL